MKRPLKLFCALLVYTLGGVWPVFSQTETWKQTVFEQLEKRQYYFHNDSPGHFNVLHPAAQLQITCSALTQSVQSAVQEIPFDYTLILTGIRSGLYEVPLYDSPGFEMNDNHLLEHHTAFTIEYLNKKQGLKQNFILFHKVGHHPRLELSLQFVSDNCFPAISGNDIAVKQLRMGNAVEVAGYTSLKVYDARGVVVPAFFKLKGNELLIEVDHENAVYPLVIDPVSTTASVQVTGNQASMQLGYCVSAAGDVNGDGYSDVIVGAPKYDNGQINEGAAFVYLGSANGLSSTPVWSGEGNQTSANYGVNVSEAGDVNGDGYGDIIVGAELYDNGQTNEGMVFVYYGSPSGPSVSPDWTFESNQANAELGFIVSTAGDINGDEYSDVIVGAPLYDNGQTDEGVAFIFHGSATGLSLTPNATLEQNQAGSEFGWSVSSAGDVNSDGFDDVIVSAVYFDNGQTDEGKAWVYLGTSGGINATANWSGESNQANAYYGENVSWAGDLNGDGYGDIVVGADYNDNGQTDEGRAFVYHGSSTGVSSTAAIILERNQAVAYFGVGVNGAGDVNGDGYGDLLVGAYFYDNGESNEGAAFLYYGSPTGVSQTLFTQLESNQASAAFGISLCSAGDVNGDGFSDVIIGAYLFDQTTPSAINDAGAFYIYNGTPENIGTTNVMSYASTQALAGMGNFVTCIGDVNGDGYSDLAVGASLFDNVQTDRGVVYIFHGSSTGYGAAPNTTINGPAFANANFGASIGAAGDVNGDGYSDIVVGAPGYSNGQASEGAFFVYLGSASGLNTSAHLSVESNLAAAALGFSVAGAGDINGDGYSDVLVGANGYTNGQTNEGRVYLYYGSATGVDATADWQFETNVTGERLGACVAGVGDVDGNGYSDIVVLSSGYTNGQTNEGRFHLFTGSDTGFLATATNVFETNVTNAGINNQSCSFIGDINGDGFNEVVIGISTFNSGGTANEGVLRIYYGAYPNLNFSTVQDIEGNATGFLLGATVGFGGDVNGDGYNDLVTGAPAFANGQTNEGIGRVYLGSSTGLLSTPVFSYEGNTVNYSTGSSVCAAGDINGDGFSDIAIGASGFDITSPSALTDAGKVFVFYGGNAHNIVPRTQLTRQYRSDLSTVVQTSNGTFETSCNFGISHQQKAHLGRERAKLLYEVRGHPHPFSGSGSFMGNSVAQSGIQGTATNLGLSGTNLTMGASAVPPMGFPKWRTRVKYNVTDAIDGQIYGRWFYGGIHDKQDRSIKVSMITCGILPVEMREYKVSCDENTIHVTWTMADESGVALYEIWGSVDGRQYDLLGHLSPRNDGNYRFAAENTAGYRMIKLVSLDNNRYEHQHFITALSCTGQNPGHLMVYPNPTSDVLYLSVADWDFSETGEIQAVIVTDMSGRQVGAYTGPVDFIDVSKLEKGLYRVSLSTSRGKKFSAGFVRM